LPPKKEEPMRLTNFHRFCIVFLHLGAAVSGLTACLSSGVRSTGASLPVDAEVLDDGVLKATVSHSCSGVRCNAIEVTFENKGDDPLTVSPTGSRIRRAGENAILVRTGEGKKPLTIAPKQSVSARFVPMSEGGKSVMTYTRPKAVWCSLKANSACKNIAKAEASCAGFARYYYDTYMSTEGWLTLAFAYEAGIRKETLESLKPQAAGVAPAATLREEKRAPAFSSQPDDIVFYKLECDAKCNCKEAAPKRNFFLDDKMRSELKQ
jgi:hypothetical protein